MNTVQTRWPLIETKYSEALKLRYGNVWMSHVPSLDLDQHTAGLYLDLEKIIQPGLP